MLCNAAGQAGDRQVHASAESILRVHPNICGAHASLANGDTSRREDEARCKFQRERRRHRLRAGGAGDGQSVLSRGSRAARCQCQHAV